MMPSKTRARAVKTTGSVTSKATTSKTARNASGKTPRQPPATQPRNGTISATIDAMTPLEQLPTFRIHLLRKLTDRTIAAIYRQQLDITLPEARIISSVGAFGPFSINQLAQRTNLDKSQASRAADAMLQQGRLVKLSDAHDGRVVLIALAEHARPLYRQVVVIARQWNADLCASLNQRELAALHGALDKLIAQANAALAAAED